MPESDVTADEAQRSRERFRANAGLVPMHLLVAPADEEGLCGASLYSPAGIPNWSILRADVTCKECIDLLDERDFDRAHE